MYYTFAISCFSSPHELSFWVIRQNVKDIDGSLRKFIALTNLKKQFISFWANFEHIDVISPIDRIDLNFIVTDMPSHSPLPSKTVASSILTPKVQPRP